MIGKILTNIFDIALEFLLWFSGVSVLLSYVHGSVFLNHTAAVVVPVAAFYLLTRYVRKFKVFIVLALICIVSAFFLPYYYRWTMILVHLFVYQISLARRVNGTAYEMLPKALICLFFVFLAVTVYRENTDMQALCTTCGIIYTVIYFAAEGINNLHGVIAENQKLADVPTNEIRKKGYAFIGGLTAMLALMLTCIPYGGAESTFLRFVRMLKLWIIKALRSIFGLMGSSSTGEAILDGGRKELGTAPIMGGGQPSPVAEILGEIVVRACTIGVVIYLIYALIRFIVEMINAFDKTAEEITETKKFITPGLFTSVKKVARKKEQTDGMLSYRQRIRNAYKQMIKYSGKKPQKSDTPEEIGIRCGITDDEIREIYEAARYCDEKPTADELARIKLLIKNYKG